MTKSGSSINMKSVNPGDLEYIIISQEPSDSENQCELSQDKIPNISYYNSAQNPSQH